MAPCLFDEVMARSVPFGTTTKNSEFFDIGPMAELGTHPPLGDVVEVTAIMWKMIVALPLFQIETLRESGLKLAEVSWNLVMSHMASETFFVQSSLSPTCG
jgi:hypothetical protein